jgi:hypothetical protein
MITFTIRQNGHCLRRRQGPLQHLDYEFVYETVEATTKGIYAAVQFDYVIDHRLSPINDEGIGKHPYTRSGLQTRIN